MQIIVPNAPGAGNDLIARLIAPKLSETIKQNVVVDNRPSANGVVGTELVARAAPDGSVLGVGNAGTHAVNASLYKKLTYDPVRDFAAVSELATTSLVIVSNPVVPAKIGERADRDCAQVARQAECRDRGSDRRDRDQCAQAPGARRHEEHSVQRRRAGARSRSCRANRTSR